MTICICRSLSTWLQAKGEELAAADMVRGIPHEVQKQLDEVQVRMYSIMLLNCSLPLFILCNPLQNELLMSCHANKNYMEIKDSNYFNTKHKPDFALMLLP